MTEEHEVARAAVWRGRLGELFFHTGDGVVVLDSDWSIQRWNPGAEHLLGYSERDVVQGPLAAVFADPGGYARVRSLLEKQGEGPDEAVVGRLRSRAGRVIEARLRLIRLDEPDSFPVAILLREEPAPGLDAAGAALVRQIHHLAEATATMGGESDRDRVAHALADLAKELLEADFAAVLLVEAAAGEDFVVTCAAINAPADVFPVEGARLAAQSPFGRPLRSAVVERVAEAGQAGVGAVLALPMVVGGRVIGEILAANRPGRRTFTELQEAIAFHLGTLAAAHLEAASLHAELKSKAEQLEEMNRKHRDLVAAIAHDLRTPAGAVRGYAELATDPKLPESKRGMVLDRLREQADQLERLVDDLSTVSRLQSGQLAIQVEPFDPGVLLDEVVADYRLRHPERRFELAPASLPEVEADRSRLRQVLTNLIDNAVKYSGRDTTVDLRGKAAGKMLQIVVCDRGHGIAADEIGHIFDPFYRSRRSSATAPGIGLGLTIARALMQAMGGELEAESRPGEGSCFTLTLPLA